jgi:ribosomal protein L7/L12
MPEPTFWIVLAVLGLSMVIAIVQGRLKDQLAALERKLDLLLRYSGIDVTVQADKEAAELLRAGKKIEAIRIYRELTGAGLAEAKAHVEGLEKAS